MKMYKSCDHDQFTMQIRRPISCVYSAVFFDLVLFISTLLLRTDIFMCIGISIFVLFYGILSFKNDRVEYDAVGLTLFSILGKPFRKNWKEILEVKIVEEPLISKQLLIGRVLKIKCMDRTNNQTMARTYVFPYRYYRGIDEFFSYCRERIASD